MNGRRKWRKRAGKEAKALGPLATNLAVDAYLVQYVPPSGTEAREFCACLVGQSALSSYGGTAAWPGRGIEKRPEPHASKGAKKVAKALTSDRCLNAVLSITQKFGM